MSLIQLIKCLNGNHKLVVKESFFNGVIQECKCECCHREYVMNNDIKLVLPLDAEIKAMNRLLGGKQNSYFSYKYNK